MDRSLLSVDHRPFDVYSYRVVTVVPFASSLAQYQDAYRQLANFLDWLQDVRRKRVNAIQTLVPGRMTPEIAAALNAMLPPPLPSSVSSG